MPSPEQLAELSCPEILKEFLADIKTSEIEAKLASIRKEVKDEPTALKEKLAEFSKIRSISDY